MSKLEKEITKAKFLVGEEVWLVRDNRVEKLTITACMFDDSLGEIIYCFDLTSRFFDFEKSTNKPYSGNQIWFPASVVFPTKEELIKSL